MSNSMNQFKTKNATMIFELNGGKNELYGRSHFKLRSDSSDPTYLRTKLVSDIHNRLGLQSSSANYVQLYINNEYMGLHIITDSFKLSWVEKVYGDKDSSTLYKCESIKDLLPKYSDGCTNENEDVTDNTEWINFLMAIKNAKSASDLEDIFEIDHFLYEMAIEYLLLGWDHIRNGHNFSMYKQPNGKWIYLPFDFDLDFDPSRFEEILKDVINKVFNPSILYPRIDELKQFIKPYVELDKTPNSEGKYPGVYKDTNNVNTSISPLFSIEQWDAFSEFNTGTSYGISYGLKYWVLVKYRNVCHHNNMECDPIYMDENYKYPINKNVDNIESHSHTTTYSNNHFEKETEYEVDTPTSYIEDKILNEKTDTTEFVESYISSENSIEAPTNILIISTSSEFIEMETMNDVDVDTPTSSTSDVENITELVEASISSEMPTTTSLKISETSTEDSSEIQTDISTMSTSSEFVEKETVYDVDVDVPTFDIDDESSSDEEDLTESVKSSTSLIHSVSTSTTTTKKITITKTSTRTVIYKTMSN
ncbi:hypothetical protein PIROE2DRAFT_17695 [Piromyces sp. E2]|nr:hypothetical protein PIROE2DRAFT_17695 [Piromyces sp. E2]|eukprot:OUM57354.1 hypothetical protein PIROE2DRAFT_17695 [Piromyces sp. E2]